MRRSLKGDRSLGSQSRETVRCGGHQVGQNMTSPFGLASVCWVVSNNKTDDWTSRTRAVSAALLWPLPGRFSPADRQTGNREMPRIASRWSALGVLAFRSCRYARPRGGSADGERMAGVGRIRSAFPDRYRQVQRINKPCRRPSSASQLQGGLGSTALENGPLKGCSMKIR